MRLALRRRWLCSGGLILVSTGFVSAADIATPIQPVTLESATRPAVDPASLSRWRLSLAPVIGSQALDVASSYGMRERNPLLADSHGRFGNKGAGTKLGATAGFLGIQYLIVRKYPRSAKVFTKLNWSVSIVTSGFAAHNFAIR